MYVSLITFRLRDSAEQVSQEPVIIQIISSLQGQGQKLLQKVTKATSRTPEALRTFLKLLEGVISQEFGQAITWVIATTSILEEAQMLSKNKNKVNPCCWDWFVYCE